MTASPQRRALAAALDLRRRRRLAKPGPVLPDPKAIVTPDAFSVSPELLGTPLATPSRRLAALVLDLVLIGFLQLLGWRFVLGGAALMLFLALVRPPAGAPPSRLRRTAAGCGGALVLIGAVLVTLLPTLLKLTDKIVVSTPDGSGPVIRIGPPAGDTTEAADTLGIADSLGIADAPENADALEAADAPESADTSGPADAPEAADALETADTSGTVDAPGSTDTQETADAAESADTLVAADAPGVESPATGLDAFAATFMRVADSIRIADSIATHADTTDIIDTTAESREPRSGGTAFDWIRDAADEAGLVFGWGTVYITLFLALWDGRTPGKRVLDLQVVRVTGGPLGLLMSFERAGGYAAGLATGLLGFARVWWDPNRQAIHDKIAETVVIREKLAKAPGLGSARRRRDIPTTTAAPARAAPSKPSNEPTEDEPR